jgi:L-aspartate oxidase
MHGADRIGGLSTANGIVFGKIAGEKAALYSSTIEETETKESDRFRLQTAEEPAQKLKEMRKIMYQHAFLKLEEESIKHARNAWEEIHFEEMNSGQEKETKEIKESEMKHIRDSYRLLNGKAAASALLTVQLMRKESRGSFYRSDYPVKDETHFRAPLMVHLTENHNETAEKQRFEVMVEKSGREEEIKW